MSEINSLNKKYIYLIAILPKLNNVEKHIHFKLFYNILVTMATTETEIFILCPS